jgi:bifunctional DNase/RNase
MEHSKCIAAGCDTRPSILLASIENRIVVRDLYACPKHVSDLFAIEPQKVVSERPGLGDYAGMANVDLRFLLSDCAKRPGEGPAMVELVEVGGAGRLVIGGIGFCEAWALGTALKQHPVPRPLTHPLMAQIIAALGARVDRMVIDRLNRTERTYYAKLHISRGIESIPVDCRPSDALIIAVLSWSPIFVSRDLLSDQGIAYWHGPGKVEQPNEGGG